MKVVDAKERGALLLRAINGSDITVFYQDVDFRYLWIENPPEGWSDDQIVGNRDQDIMPPEMAETVVRAKLRVLETRKNVRVDVQGEFDGALRAFDLWIDPDLDAAGNVVGLLCTSVEVTELRRREANLQHLLREVSHRSRNLLAIVQSIARQTITHANTSEGFMKRFGERLQSISHSLDVVTRREWDGATVHDLLRKQVAPFLPTLEQLRVEGEDPVLDANAAVHVGLAVQELGSNAANHGAWSNSRGRVTVEVEALPSNIEPNSDPSGRRASDINYCLTWTEDIPSKGISSEHMNFGGHTLRSVVPAAVNGEASLEIDDTALVYKLELPAENFRP